MFFHLKFFIEEKSYFFVESYGDLSWNYVLEYELWVHVDRRADRQSENLPIETKSFQLTQSPDRGEANRGRESVPSVVCLNLATVSL